MIVDTERDGWTRVSGSLGWRKSLRDRHWAQVTRSRLGWSFVILKVDKDTMCPIAVADGEDISLAAVKDDVDHWNDHYHRHVVVISATTRLPQRYDRWWRFECRYCGGQAGMLPSWDAAALLGRSEHVECEAAWQRGER